MSLPILNRRLYPSGTNWNLLTSQCLRGQLSPLSQYMVPRIISPLCSLAIPFKQSFKQSLSGLLSGLFSSLSGRLFSKPSCITSSGSMMVISLPGSHIFRINNTRQLSFRAHIICLQNFHELHVSLLRRDRPGRLPMHIGLVYQLGGFIHKQGQCPLNFN